MATKQPIERVQYQPETLSGIGLELMAISDLYDRFLVRRSPLPEQFHFFLLLMTEGRGQHLVDFHPYSYEPGTVFVIGKDQVQQFAETRTGNGWLLAFTDPLILHFEQQEAAQQLLLFSSTPVRPCFQLSAEQLQTVSAMMNQLQAEYCSPVQDVFRPSILRSCLHMLLLTLERYKQLNQPAARPGTYLETFSHFKQLVEAHCFTTRDVADYADLLGCSPRKLNAITQAAVCKSAKVFIADTFLLQIKRLLVSTPLSTKEIAYKTGFDEPAQFIRYVKQYGGQLPAAFRALDSR